MSHGIIVKMKQMHAYLRRPTNNIADDGNYNEPNATAYFWVNEFSSKGNTVHKQNQDNANE